MKLVLLLLLFAPFLYKIMKQKDWYVCLLFGLYTNLPNTFAIELTSFLPLLTAGRIIILINILILLRKYDFKIKFLFPSFVTKYFLLMLAIMVLDLRVYLGGVADIFNLVLEQIAVVWIVCHYIKNSDDFYRYSNLFLQGFSLNCIVGIIQTVFKFDLSETLNIVGTRSETGLALRMGLERASGMTGSAIMLAAECTFMILLSLYIYEKFRKGYFLSYIAIYIVTIFCTMSRSSIISLLILFTIIIATHFGTFLVKYSKYLLGALIMLLVAMFVSPKLFEALFEPVKSVLNLVGFNVDIASNFGDNASNPARSRLFQWSAITSMINDGHILFGYGYRAYTRGMIKFFYQGYNSWDVARALDVGFVKIIAEYGIAAVMARFYLYIKMYRLGRKTDFGKGKFKFKQFCLYFIILYVLNNVLTACPDTGIVWIIIALILAYSNVFKMNASKISVVG